MRSRRSAWRGESFVLLSAVLLACSWFLAPPARAHNAVIESVPAPDSVVEQSPLTIRITTNDQLLDLGGVGGGFGIAVQDAAGLYYGDGCVEIGTYSLSATVALGEAGVYSVIYRYVSADGHSLSDQYSFTFSPGPDHQPTGGVPNFPACGEVSEPSEPEGSKAPSPETAEGPPAEPHSPPSQAANPWLVGSGFVVAGLALVSLVIFPARRRSQG